MNYDTLSLRFLHVPNKMTVGISLMSRRKLKWHVTCAMSLFQTDQSLFKVNKTT